MTCQCGEIHEIAAEVGMREFRCACHQVTGNLVIDPPTTAPQADVLVRAQLRNIEQSFRRAHHDLS